MKKIVCISSFALLMLFSLNLNAQKFSSLDKSPMDAASFPSSYKTPEKIIKIVYSRPQLKGRSLDKLAPNKKVWRTGANEAPELTLYKDLKLGNTIVKAGVYALFTIPGKEEWTVILNSDLNVWGAYFYKQENDVVRLSVPVTKGVKSLEAFSIVFDQVDDVIQMHLGWGEVRVAVPFTK
ncbi:MAG: DUF2911 domain-containing protein [Flavobacteriaceae bacterium]|nr:DUF2911 domain-containing protein [Flavobacteriaceae bacterium]